MIEKNKTNQIIFIWFLFIKELLIEKNIKSVSAQYCIILYFAESVCALYIFSVIQSPQSIMLCGVSLCKFCVCTACNTILRQSQRSKILFGFNLRAVYLLQYIGDSGSQSSHSTVQYSIYNTVGSQTLRTEYNTVGSQSPLCILYSV